MVTNIGVLATARKANGGTLLYTLSMIEAIRQLPADRFACIVYTQANNREYDDSGLPIIRLPNAVNVATRRALGKQLFDEVDKVIAPVYSLLLLASSRPFAFTLHDLQEKHLSQNFSVATRIWRHLTNRVLTALAARIVCESNFVKHDIIRFFRVPDAKIAVMPAPPVSLLLECKLDAQDLATVRNKFSLPDNYVLYPAQFWPHKNHRRLIEAFARVVKTFPDCCLVLTGRPRDEYEKVLDLVRKLDLASHVRHIGYVETAEIAALYRCATVAAIPTLFESISIPIYEAFSIGTAVCASNVLALPEQVGDAGVLFDPLSPKDIAEKICLLLGNPNLRRQLIERGHRRMTAVTHDEYAQSLARLMDSIGEPDACARR
jgi:glycosyltransferase involved in cell wall biosynthesis